MTVENERRVGVNSGGMDQAASVMSDPSSALYISFYPLLAASPVPLPPKVVFVCANSLVVSDKATTAKYRYNLRVVETLVGARILAKEIGVTMGDKERITFRQVIGRFLGEEGDLDAEQLQDALENASKEINILKPKAYRDTEDADNVQLGVTLEEMIEMSGLSRDIFYEAYLSWVEVEATYFQLYKRAKHVLSESLRVLQFRKICLEAASLQTVESVIQPLGNLMNASQTSCSSLFECSCPELDMLTELAREAGAYGSRLTGAGWGGCTVSLVAEDKKGKRLTKSSLLRDQAVELVCTNLLDSKGRKRKAEYPPSKDEGGKKGRKEGSPSPTMDIVKAVETYVAKMVSTPPTMKVLLLDMHTTPIVSLASTQSVLLSHQVYLTDRIDNKKRDRMPHMKCACFVQNSDESLEALEAELREPKYGEYYLYFSNILSKSAVERLAEVDEYEVVREVQEVFADYAPLLPCLFSLNHIPSQSRPLYGTSHNMWDPRALQVSIQGIIAVLLSLKKRPIIRYERMSAVAKKLGTEVYRQIQTESSLFDFRLTQVPPLLLILDRRNDPVTPLLSQWTYQAMVHELIGIQNGRVDLSLVPDIRPDLSEITLTTATDPFFQGHFLDTFGDLGTNLKDYVQSYQTKSLAQSPTSINSISDMKRFIEEFPEFRKLGGNVSKHVALVGELSRLVDKRKLLEVGEIEQGLATSSGADFKSVQGIVADNALSPWYKLRVVMLYALRYQKTQINNIAFLVNLLLANGVAAEDARLVYVILNIAGSEQRQDDLFSTESLLAKGRSALKGLKGVENVYTQHNPHLAQTLELLVKGRLKETSYPFLEGPGVNAGLQRPQDVIVFIIGGTTYEEAKIVAQFNQEQATSSGGGAFSSYGVRVLLGGTCVHNSSSYLEMLKSAAASFPLSVYDPPLESAPSAPSLSLNLGGVNVSLGGPAGSGVYRTSDDSVGMQADGIRDGVMNLIGKVKQGLR
ncbi:hypothetical protein AX15_002262 [Amanita polypyramis BW_CC]|nr:hypothetical protein AX15_002262 [Amanita polypyramis BW_CC]